MKIKFFFNKAIQLLLGHTVDDPFAISSLCFYLHDKMKLLTHHPYPYLNIFFYMDQVRLGYMRMVKVIEFEEDENLAVRFFKNLAGICPRINYYSKDRFIETFKDMKPLCEDVSKTYKEFTSSRKSDPFDLNFLMQNASDYSNLFAVQSDV